MCTPADRPARLVVLGPQRRPTVDSVARALPAALGEPARFAVVTAGWQEREPDDGELTGLLGGSSVNLRLYARWLDVLDADGELATAERDHRAVLDELQRLYLLQLDAALAARYEIAASTGRPRARAAALTDADAVVQLVDERHERRVQAAQADFDAAWRPAERPVPAAHRTAVAAELAAANTLVLAGGHVGVLLRVLAAFGVGAGLPGTVLAWSAGAMALTERVVLFHDRVPQGSSHPEVYDRGLGVIRGVVLLPHARRRLRVDDPVRMAALARRFAPARCVVLDDGVRLELAAGPGGTELPAGTRVVTEAGRIAEVAA